MVSVSEAAAASEDVDALMKQPQEKKEGTSAQDEKAGAHPDEKASQAGQHNQPHHPAHHKPKDVKFERFLSKISYYLSAYLPYLALLLLFCALLFYALTSAFIKLG